MQSFLTRLPNSPTRTVLLVPCLLVCLACVTPFPLGNLEKGMTMEQATGAFGEPSSTNTEELSEVVQLLQRENDRIYERLESGADLSDTRGPVAQKLEQLSTETLRSPERFVAELDEASSEQGVRSTWVYPHEEYDGAWWLLGAVPFVGWVFVLDGAHLDKQEVYLRFEGNELVSWETRPAPSVPTTGTYVYQDPFPSTMTFPSKKEAAHHRKGHKHHHGHGC